MKALATQFDDRRLTNAVATPTCSSCCCCCCCLATSISASSLLTQRIAKEGERHQVANRHFLPVVSALFVPIVGLLVYFSYWFINIVTQHCTTHVSSYSGESYESCSSLGGFAIAPILFIVPFLVLWYLYLRVKIEHPLTRALLVTTLICVSFAAEFAAGAFLILTGVGAIGYIILVPFVVGWISVWYHKHLGKEGNSPPGRTDLSQSVVQAPAAPLAPFRQDQPQQPNMEQHEQNSPADPSQPNPPTPSS